jgi:tRNA(Ile)-lysidine synthase
MEAKFKQFIAEYLNKGERVVIGVSAGPDSMALLRLAEKFLVGQFVVAHVNHGLRKESEKEEEYLAHYCAKNGLPLLTKQLNPLKATEEYLRGERYKFFRKLMVTEKASYIMVAHNLNDQAETILLNLVRGSGPLEIWGMQEREGQILRPFLTVSKSEILAYNEQLKIKYFIDESNLRNDYKRNLIRNKVIPLLESINPRFLETAGREAELGHEMAVVVQNVVASELKKIQTGNQVDLKKLKKLPLFVQKAVIREMIFEMTGKKSDVYSKNVNEVLKITHLEGSKKTTFGQFTIVKNYDKITFNPVQKRGQKTLKITVGEVQNFNGFTIKTTILDGKAVKNNILLSPEFAYNLSVRTWQAGDKIKTKGGVKKLQDLFTDAKIEAAQRQIWPILVTGDEILWVPLLAASEKALHGS